MSAPGYPGYQVSRDPTAVIGARIGAWIINFVLLVALSAFLGPTPLSPLAEYHDLDEIAPGADGAEVCEDLQEIDDDIAACLPIGDRIYVTENADAAIQLGVTALYLVLIHGVWSGVSGLTPGKALFGLRTVGEDGRPPGIGRALLRTLLWIADGAPWCFPLVALVTGMSTKGHRRVGDIAAKTFVVNKEDAGRPIVVPGMPGPGGYGYGQPSYTGAPGYGAPGYGSGQGYGPQPPPPSGYPGPGYPPAQAPGTPGTWGSAPPAESRPAPPTAPWGAPPSSESGEEPATPPDVAAGIATPQPQPDSPFGVGAMDSGETPAPPESTQEPAPAAPGEAAPGDIPGERGEREAAEEAPEPPAEEAPGAEPGEPETAPTEVQPEVAAESSQQPGAQGQAPTYNPQWDAARGTYIQWDPNRGRWLAWDDNAKQWDVI